MITSQKSIPDLDPAKPVAVIVCATCKHPLWKIEVRHFDSKIVSSSILPVNAGIPNFRDDNQDCPKCLHPYMKYNAKTKQPEPIFKSVVTGNVLKG